MNWRGQLRQAMVEYFSESEIKSLCFDLGLDYDDLSGENKTEKIISLIEYSTRMNDLPRLISYCSQNRPNVPWDEIEEAARREKTIGSRPTQFETLPASSRRSSVWLIFIFAAIIVVTIAVSYMVFRSLQPTNGVENGIAEATTVPEAEIGIVTVLAPTSSETEVPPTLTELPAPTNTMEPTETPVPTYTPQVWPVSETGVEACHLTLGDQTTARQNARLWSEPDVGNGNFVLAVEPGATVEILDGPVWGLIRNDVDISGWWWLVETTSAGDNQGWVWEARLEGCSIP